MLILGSSLTVLPDFEHATALLGRALSRARAQGHIGLMARALVSLEDAALYSGDWSLALRASDECARLATEAEIGTTVLRDFAQLTQATLAGMRGDEDRANTLMDEAETNLAPLGFTSMLCFIEIARAAIATGAGRHTEAFGHISRAFDPSQRGYDLVVASRGLLDLVEAAVRTGHEPHARAALAALEPVAESSQSPFIRASLSYARPMLADSDETAEALYHAALGDQPAAVPFLRARVLLQYGTWLRRRRRVADSRAPLRSARDAFDRMAAVTWAERARQELRASGEKSPGRLPDRRDDLTPQELQIAQMAAERLSNREIGERLFLSPRTVGSHLYRIFPKLGVTSRSELATAMRRSTDGSDPMA
jgi:ATP/maltotriose-dependent transcriptional regulator MalT